MKLCVHKLSINEVYRDFARIPEEYRLNRRSQLIEEGVICSLMCQDTGREVFLIARGSKRSGAYIGLDERTRNRLKNEAGKSYDFDIRETDLCGKVRWALEASDVNFSFPATLALISVGLGLLSLFLAIASIVTNRVIR